MAFCNHLSSTELIVKYRKLNMVNVECSSFSNNFHTKECCWCNLPWCDDKKLIILVFDRLAKTRLVKLKMIQFQCQVDFSMHVFLMIRFLIFLVLFCFIMRELFSFCSRYLSKLDLVFIRCCNVLKHSYNLFLANTHILASNQGFIFCVLT